MMNKSQADIKMELLDHEENQKTFHLKLQDNTHALLKQALKWMNPFQSLLRCSSLNFATISNN